MLNTFKTTARGEAWFQKLLYDDQGNVIDVADLVGRTPFDDLLSKEEQSLLDPDNVREAQLAVVSGLLSYLFKDREPLEILMRIFLLAYTINPSLIDGITLEEMGRQLGGVSKQRLASKLAKQDEFLGYRGRNRKTEAQKQASSEAQKLAWQKRKAKAPEPKTQRPTQKNKRNE